MLNKLFIKAHAEGGINTRGTASEQTRPGQARTFNPNRPAPRRGESMSQYLRRTQQSDIGATNATRGRTTRVVVRPRRARRTSTR